jgi:DNA-directed RNA polymerase subunit F
MEKYSKISKILELGFERSFMILTDITPTGAEALRTIFYMNVVLIENFSEEFNKIIIKYKNASIDPNNLISQNIP